MTSPSPVSASGHRLYYGYVIVAAALVIQLIAWGSFGAFGVFVKPFQTEFGSSRAAVSGVASVVLLVHGISSIIMGNLSDRWGPRIVMTIAGLICAIGFFLTSRTHALWQLYLTYGVVVGVGVGALDVVLLSSIARWFRTRRGIMTGIVKAGAGAGHLTIPLTAGMLIVALDWRGAYAIVAGVNVVFILLISQFLRRDPSVMGLKAYGDYSKDTPSESGLALRQAIRTWQFWSVVGIYLMVLFCTYTVQVHIAAYAQGLGFSVTGAAAFLSIIGGSSIVGRFGMGAVGDRLGIRRTFIFSTVVLCIALFALMLARQPWILYVIVPFYGFAHGATYSLISPLVARWFGTKAQGAIYGVVIFGGTIGGAAGPLLAGSIYDNTGSYSLAFLILSAAAATGIVLLATLKPVKAKELDT
jgi:MFS family permease